jgi:hypothetical protein
MKCWKSDIRLRKSAVDELLFVSEIVCYEIVSMLLIWFSSGWCLKCSLVRMII